MTVDFRKISDIEGSNYVRTPIYCSAILNIENGDKNLFLGSVLAHLHPCQKFHQSRVSNLTQFLIK